MLIIIGISNETGNELNIYTLSCRNVTMFYRQELASIWSSFHWAWPFAFLIQGPFVKILSCESTSKLFYCFQLLKPNMYTSLEISVCPRWVKRLI